MNVSKVTALSPADLAFVSLICSLSNLSTLKKNWHNTEICLPVFLLSDVFNDCCRIQSQITQNSRQHERVLRVGHDVHGSAYPGSRPKAELGPVHQVAQFSDILCVQRPGLNDLVSTKSHINRLYKNI
jgi:hypothetical protein